METLKKIIIPLEGGGINEISLPDTYLKSETYSKPEIDQKIKNLTKDQYNKLDFWNYPDTLFLVDRERLYLGSNLIWKKEEEEGGNYIKGKFTLPIEDLSIRPWTISGVTEVSAEIDPEYGDFKIEYSGVATEFKNRPGETSKLLDIDLSHFDTSGITTANLLFAWDHKLRYANLTGMNKDITNWSGCFYACENLERVVFKSTEGYCKPVDISRMFRDDTNPPFLKSKIESIDLTSYFDLSSIVSASRVFGYNLKNLAFSVLDFSNIDTTSTNNQITTFLECRNLTNIQGPGVIRGIKKTISLEGCPLTPSSAMAFIRGLEEVTTTETLYLSKVTFNSLTPEQISVATSKGWDVVA